MEPRTRMKAPETLNPLLEEWTTPFGVPPFDEIEDIHFEPALLAAMAEERAEIEVIVTSSEPATFKNTIEALERSGKMMRRVGRVFYTRNSSHSNEAIRQLARKMAPIRSAHNDDIVLDPRLFARVEAVYSQRDSLPLDAEQRWLLEELRKMFVRAGAGLDAEAQERLREINSEIAERYQEFGQNLLAENNAYELHVTEREDLGALPETLVSVAADDAVSRGHEGGWSFTLSRSSIEPFLQYSPNRELRRQIFLAFAQQGDNGNEHDNNAALARLAALRAERAALLGFETHAHFVLADSMAETPERVMEFLDKVWKPALTNADTERDALAAMMRAEGVTDELRGWDWRFYAEKVRKARFDLDEDALRPFFELSAVREGAFTVANRLYGLTFEELGDLPRWHPDQLVFEVKEGDGSHLGLLYMDFFTRESKRVGAWMNDLRAQSKLDGDVKAIVTTDFNFPPPSGDSPCLLSFDDALTIFHEFGHALHGLLSDVTYPSLSGTNVPRDFVEFPSQVMENWMSEPEVLRLFAHHVGTGEVIPEELITKVKAAETFNQGFATVEYMAASYLDMAWHSLSWQALQEQAEKLEFETLEDDAMRRIGLIDEILPRYRSPYFSHVFSGGYAAGYYSYLWAGVLDSDGFQAFRETSLFDGETAKKIRRLLSRGGSRPGMDLYREFRGRDPEIGPLLERRGLVSAS